MTNMNCPYAPITPQQEAEIRALAGSYGRRERARILAEMPRSTERAAACLRRLRGEPEPGTVPLDKPSQLDQRAANAIVRARLDAAFAGRAMQGRGPGSLFAGLNGNPWGMLR